MLTDTINTSDTVTTIDQSLEIIDEDDANFRIAQMYLNAAKRDYAFPFLVQAANNKHKDATKTIIQHYPMNTLADEDINIVKRHETLLKQTKDKGVSAYMLGNTYWEAMHLKTSAECGFILGLWKYALYQYKVKDYAKAKKWYLNCVESPDFVLLPQLFKGYIYNDISLCGWFLNDRKTFALYNLLASQESCATAFSNRANAYFRAELMCDTPDYASALWWYTEALSLTLPGDEYSNKQIEYLKTQIALCKKHIETK